MRWKCNFLVTCKTLHHHGQIISIVKHGSGPDAYFCVDWERNQSWGEDGWSNPGRKPVNDIRLYINSHQKGPVNPEPFSHSRIHGKIYKLMFTLNMSEFYRVKYYAENLLIFFFPFTKILLGLWLKGIKIWKAFRNMNKTVAAFWNHYTM